MSPPVFRIFVFNLTFSSDQTHLIYSLCSSCPGIERAILDVNIILYMLYFYVIFKHDVKRDVRGLAFSASVFFFNLALLFTYDFSYNEMKLGM